MAERRSREILYLPGVTVLQIERYKPSRLHAVSPATVNRELAGIKRLFNLAEQ